MEREPRRRESYKPTAIQGGPAIGLLSIFVVENETDVSSEFPNSRHRDDRIQGS